MGGEHHSTTSRYSMQNCPLSDICSMEYMAYRSYIKCPIITSNSNCMGVYSVCNHLLFLTTRLRELSSHLAKKAFSCDLLARNWEKQLKYHRFDVCDIASSENPPTSYLCMSESEFCQSLIHHSKYLKNTLL